MGGFFEGSSGGWGWVGAGEDEEESESEEESELEEKGEGSRGTTTMFQQVAWGRKEPESPMLETTFGWDGEQEGNRRLAVEVNNQDDHDG